MTCEIMGPLLVFVSGRRWLCGKALNFHIDILSGLCALAKGGAKKGLASLHKGGGRLPVVSKNIRQIVQVRCISLPSPPPPASPFFHSL